MKLAASYQLQEYRCGLGSVNSYMYIRDKTFKLRYSSVLCDHSNAIMIGTFMWCRLLRCKFIVLLCVSRCNPNRISTVVKVTAELLRFYYGSTSVTRLQRRRIFMHS